MAQPVPDDARYEVKFVAEATRYHELERWILLNRAAFRIAYPPRQVNNLYFDNAEMFAFTENISGASSRSKVRLRWYGQTFRPDRCVLEVKRRHNQLGWKHQFPLDRMDFRHRKWTDICRNLRRELPIWGKVWLDAYPEPVLINRYHRQYFESGDGRVRATLDVHQRALDQRMSVRPNLRNLANLPHTLVVEVKFAHNDHALGKEVIRGIPIRVSRNSKYVIGVQSMTGHLGT